MPIWKWSKGDEEQLPQLSEDDVVIMQTVTRRGAATVSELAFKLAKDEGVVIQEADRLHDVGLLDKRQDGAVVYVPTFAASKRFG
jgi:predicted transcriptional regulator